MLTSIEEATDEKLAVQAYTKTEKTHGNERKRRCSSKLETG